MEELKTRPTDASAEGMVESIDDESRREDCRVLLGLMKRATGEEPTVWNTDVVGFGTFRYKSASGREGDWFPVGFASRKAALTVYLGLSLKELEPLLGKLGKHTAGKGCIYVRRLADVDLTVLEELVADAYARIRRTYG